MEGGLFMTLIPITILMTRWLDGMFTIRYSIDGIVNDITEPSSVVAWAKFRQLKNSLLFN